MRVLISADKGTDRYCFIESFSLVFVEIYGFNLGQNGLAYMCACSFQYSSHLLTFAITTGAYSFSQC